MKTKIITHAGQAHRDDFLSTCWLAADPQAFEVEISRREPTAQELDNPDIWVVDVGGRYEPELRNFDHHQFDRDHPATCALQLLLENQLGAEEAHAVFPWLAMTGIADSKGPAVAAMTFRAPVEMFTRYGSPVEHAMLEMFGRCDFINVRYEVLGQTMTEIGRGLRRRAQGLGDAISTIVVDLVRVGNIETMIARPETVKAVDPAWVPEVMSIKMQQLKSLGASPGASISPNVDGRGPGWVLYRYDGTGGVDFFRIRHHPLVMFAHANGFIAKVKPEATEEQLKELLVLSTREEVTV